MKTLRLIVVSMVFAGLFVVSAIAQAPTSTSKIALVDTEAFYSNTGINKILDGIKRVQVELKPEGDKFDQKITQFNALKKSYDDLLAKGSSGVPVKPEDVQNKREQLTVLQTDIKRMQEDLKVKQQKRQTEVLSPIIAEVGKSLQTYIKQKGYTLVLDVGKMYNAQMLIYFESNTDITEEFIKFYNTKPGGTASK